MYLRRASRVRTLTWLPHPSLRPPAADNYSTLGRQLDMARVTGAAAEGLTDSEPLSKAANNGQARWTPHAEATRGDRHTAHTPGDAVRVTGSPPPPLHRQGDRLTVASIKQLTMQCDRLTAYGISVARTTRCLPGRQAHCIGNQTSDALLHDTMPLRPAASIHHAPPEMRTCAC